MTLHPKNHWGIPQETIRVARAAFPKGNMYMKMYDELGTLYADSDFKELFPALCGQSAISPAKLAIITVMQFAEGLSDRQAADAVRSRIDWKYILGLELTDSGFDCSVLSEFRSRLCEHGCSNKLLDLMLVRFQQKNLINHRGKQRTDSTQVIAAIRQVNRLELVGETLRAALNEIASCAPDGEVTSVVHHKLAEKDLLPKEHYVDAAYVDAKELVESHQIYQVSVVGPVAVDTSWQAKLKTGFDVSAFVIDWDKQVVQCPQGSWSRNWRTTRDCNTNPLIEVVFDHKICFQCPMRSPCTSAKTAARKLKLRPRDEYDALKQRRHQQQTPEFEQDYARRAGVEGTISQGVCRFDLRRTRYCGLAKTHLQHVATACAINLARFFAWSNHRFKAQTRKSSFAALGVKPA